MARSIKAIVFDLDGVLIDSERIAQKVVRSILLREVGIELSEEDCRKCSGASDEGVSVYVRDKFGIEVKPSRISRITGEHFRKRRRIPKMKWALKTVRMLSRRFPLAVASSSPSWYVIKFLRSEGFYPRLSAVASGDEVRRKKPAPDVYLLAAKRLKVNPKNCLAVEDSEAGVLAAKRAGMACFAIKSSHAKGADFSKADLVLSRIKDLPKKALRISSQKSAPNEKPI